MCASPEGNDTTCELWVATDLELHIHHDPNLGTERQQFKSILEIPRRHQNTQEYDVCPFVSVFSSFMAASEPASSSFSSLGLEDLYDAAQTW